MLFLEFFQFSDKTTSKEVNNDMTIRLSVSLKNYRPRRVYISVKCLILIMKNKYLGAVISNQIKMKKLIFFKGFIIQNILLLLHYKGFLFVLYLLYLMFLIFLLISFLTPTKTYTLSNHRYTDNSNP